MWRHVDVTWACACLGDVTRDDIRDYMRFKINIRDYEAWSQYSWPLGWKAMFVTVRFEGNIRDSAAWKNISDYGFYITFVTLRFKNHIHDSLKIETVYFSEMLDSTLPPTRRYNPEEHRHTTKNLTYWSPQQNLGIPDVRVRLSQRTKNAFL
jgi:hypothetical protein